MNSTKKDSVYDFKKIENKWQKVWRIQNTFSTTEDPQKPKYYVLDMFPYPSGDGLHVGHPEGYTATDIIARMKRMQGFNVLHPMGWDAFGLPAEQHAIKTGTHPKATTKENIQHFKSQLCAIGLSYDWQREIDTTDPKYYKWTQWIFLKLFEKGLAYQSFQPVNWCEELGTVLANEEVIDGKSEVGGHPVKKKPMRQWVLKITEYAERLLQDLDELDWPESIKEMQRHWIGKSYGANIEFAVAGRDERFTVFTTRPDTLFGATFCVLAPEHPLVNQIVSADQREKVAAYVDEASRKSDLERTDLAKDKSGVASGAFAVNPANGQKIPIYVADYVLVSYGHGAIMAVPGHDLRDHEFATKFKIPITRVIEGGEPDISKEAHTGDGLLINSDFLDGLGTKKAIAEMIRWLADNKKGEGCINYKLRDWLFSRQRYWGEPFPIVFDEKNTPHVLSAQDLPVVLPELEDFKPTKSGEPPLAKAHDWLTFKKNGQTMRRETNVMPQWAGSCWYYLRFIDPHNEEVAFDKTKEKYWMPVDLYVGGAEHAVLHLLYARFWHKVLFDLGYVTTKEPFKRLVNQGMILGENGEKMSKSRGNVVNPNHVIDEWGADSLRLYEMFMGPLEATKPWQTNGIVGVHRFLKRFLRLIVGEDNELAKKISDSEDSLNFQKALHSTIKKVTEDTENLRFNTALSQMMELTNLAYKENSVNKKTAAIMTQLLSPYAPHLAEEIWQILGHGDSIAYEKWPTFDESLTVRETVTISVTVNGKLRGTLDVATDITGEQALNLAKALPQVQKHITGKQIKKEIYVPLKIVNLVVS